MREIIQKIYKLKTKGCKSNIYRPYIELYAFYIQSPFACFNRTQAAAFLLHTSFGSDIIFPAALCRNEIIPRAGINFPARQRKTALPGTWRAVLFLRRSSALFEKRYGKGYRNERRYRKCGYLVCGLVAGGGVKIRSAFFKQDLKGCTSRYTPTAFCV